MGGGAKAAGRGGVLPARAAGALKGFLDLVERLARETKDFILADDARDGGGRATSGTVAEQVEHMLTLSGPHRTLQKEKSEKAESRVENLEELISAARGFEHNEADGFDALSAFLAHAALEAGEGEADPWEDCVQLMSLHSAKGLEFPLVFLTGLEEGLFRTSARPRKTGGSRKSAGCATSA